jgi:hypothetical protein
MDTFYSQKKVEKNHFHFIFLIISLKIILAFFLEIHFDQEGIFDPFISLTWKLSANPSKIILSNNVIELIFGKYLILAE